MESYEEKNDPKYTQNEPQKHIAAPRGTIPPIIPKGKPLNLQKTTPWLWISTNLQAARDSRPYHVPTIDNKSWFHGKSNHCSLNSSVVIWRLIAVNGLRFLCTRGISLLELQFAQFQRTQSKQIHSSHDSNIDLKVHIYNDVSFTTPISNVHTRGKIGMPFPHAQFVLNVIWYHGLWYGE